MADEAARMMMDLGLARRDIVSAPDTDRRGHAVHRDRRTEAAMQAELEARRERFAMAAESTDERTRAISAWNTQSNFSRDPVAENHGNWMSGQGHREPGRQRNYDSHAEALDNQVGEERRLFLQERQARATGNYTTASGPASGGYSPSSRMPRVMSGHGPSVRRINPQFSDRDLIPAPRPSGNRAPSPRRAGTVRFVAGQRVQTASRVVQNQFASIRAAAASAAGTAPVRAAAQSAGTTARPRSATPGSHLVAASSRSAPSPLAQSRQDANASSRSALAQTSETRAPSALGTTEQISGSGTSAAAQPHSENDKAAYRNLAVHYAANPGREADLYHAEHPDRLQYLRPSWIQLIKDACKRAKYPTSRDTVDYLTNHADQRWIFEGVCKAKEMVEKRSIAEVDEYYANHPAEEDFCKAVRFYVKDGFYGHTETAVASPIESPAPAAPAMHSAQSTAVPQQDVAAVGPQSAQSPQPTAALRQAAAAATTAVELQSPATAEIPAATSAEAPAKPKGALTATCISAIGDHFLKKCFELDAAVNVTVHFNVLDPFVGLQDLIAQMEGLSKAMQGATSNLAASMAKILKVASMSSPATRSRSAATTTTRMPQPPRQQYDVHLADDGLYDSD